MDFPRRGRSDRGRTGRAERGPGPPAAGAAVRKIRVRAHRGRSRRGFLLLDLLVSSYSCFLSQVVSDLTVVTGREQVQIMHCHDLRCYWGCGLFLGSFKNMFAKRARNRADPTVGTDAVAVANLHPQTVSHNCYVRIHLQRCCD